MIATATMDRATEIRPMRSEKPAMLTLYSMVTGNAAVPDRFLSRDVAG
jgi:hypothetical protein